MRFVLLVVRSHLTSLVDIVLEWVKGGDLLDHIIKSEIGLSEEATRDIAYQTCDALKVRLTLPPVH